MATASLSVHREQVRGTEPNRPAAKQPLDARGARVRPGHYPFWQDRAQTWRHGRVFG